MHACTLLPQSVEDGKMDFNNISQTVTFEPSLSQVQESVTINLIDDSINEAEEGFVIVIQVVEIGSVDQQGLILDRNGVALVRITDNDRKLNTILLHACYSY